MWLETVRWALIKAKQAGWKEVCCCLPNKELVESLNMKTKAAPSENVVMADIVALLSTRRKSSPLRASRQRRFPLQPASPLTLAICLSQYSPAIHHGSASVVCSSPLKKVDCRRLQTAGPPTFTQSRRERIFENLTSGDWERNCPTTAKSDGPGYEEANHVVQPFTAIRHPAIGTRPDDENPGVRALPLRRAATLNFGALFDTFRFSCPRAPTVEELQFPTAADPNPTLERLRRAVDDQKWNPFQT
ncbi:UDP-N-acetylmuramate--L-alanine ligase [Striga asiatica]|uniref:UDP-N-acetylmuramate--L-alanine ligase n=1 Tax=Striga asiatica TaxID=4170 RepID=A0A5A7QZQ0_STRAF|nr:UDP-N-acetylmuramate--L-alanine ligase [Striga asiatica]